MNPDLFFFGFNVHQHSDLDSLIAQGRNIGRVVNDVENFFAVKVYGNGINTVFEIVVSSVCRILIYVIIECDNGR